MTPNGPPQPQVSRRQPDEAAPRRRGTLDVQRIADQRRAISAFGVGLASATESPRNRPSPRDSSQGRVRFQSGHCGDRNGMGPALLPEPAVLFLPANTARQLVGWYQQQSTPKFTLNSNSYSIKRLSARGTRLKISIITTTYEIPSISNFQKDFHSSLKTHVKDRRSRPFCWYFCWHRGTNVHGEFRYSERGN